MLSEDKIIAIFCLVDDMLKAIGHYEPAGRKLSDAEVITTAIVSALYYHGHQDNARMFMKITRLMPRMLEKSRFNRRLHRLEGLICSLFFQVGHLLKAMAGASEYIIDSFPVAVCHNIRISRSRLLKGEKYRGYNASKRQYFYGVKVQLLTTGGGIPVEFCFCPGSEGDVAALSQLPLQLCPESRIYADSAYTDYRIEDLMAEEEQIGLMVQRRKNSLRPDKPWIVYLKEQMRKRIETSISSLTNLFPKKIHAVTPQGFLLKIVLFIAAFAFNELL